MHSNTPFTRYNRLSNRLYNRLDNRLYRVYKHPTGCQPAGWMFVYTIQPVAPSHGGLGPHLIHGSLSPTEPTIPEGYLDRFGRFYGAHECD